MSLYIIFQKMENKGIRLRIKYKTETREAIRWSPNEWIAEID